MIEKLKAAWAWLVLRAIDYPEFFAAGMIEAVVAIIVVGIMA